MYYPYLDRYQLYENLPIYILITIILILVTIFVYIKLAFPFWNIQPVYHSYDFWRALYSRPFLIQKRFLMNHINKYHDFKQVETVAFVDATDKQKKTFVNALQCFLLPSEHSVFVFNNENLETYFGGHMFSSYLSFYTQPNYTKIHESNEPVGCISSRSGKIYIRNSIELPIYYIDFLCIHREANYKKISRTLLQTHIYKQQLLEHIDTSRHVGYKSIMISLFRREKELLFGIVPLTRFQTVYYEIPRANSNTILLPEHTILISIDHTNMDLFLDFLESCISRFECFLRADIANVVGMIKAGILYVYCLKRMDDIISVYIFRDTRTSYDGFGGLLQLVASIHNSNSREVFMNGFVKSLFEIVKKVPVYRVFMMDEISDNFILMNMRNRVINRHWTAYYLYNMVTMQIANNNIFILL